MRFVGPTRRLAPAALAAVLVVAPAERAIAQVPTTRPTAALSVLGGDQETVYRGWPIRVELQNLTDAADAAPGTLKVIGPTAVDPQPAPHTVGLWVISPEQSKTMAAGNYVFSAGGVTCKVAVEDEPAELSPSQQSAKRSCRVSYALVTDDTAGAERIAREWVTAAPHDPDAQVALGDVLAGSGKLPEALAAYNEAINHMPPGVKPPSAILNRAGEIRDKLVVQTTTRPADEPSDLENAYYKIIAEGDAARAGKNDAVALRAYQKAKKYRADHNLTVSPRELDEKITFVSQRQAKPGKSTR